MAEDLDAEDWQGRPDGRPWVELREHSSAPGSSDVQLLAERAAAAPRGAIVCGPEGGELAAPVTRLAAQLGWPVLAEPTSGLRCGEHDRSHVVAHYDLLLRSEHFAAANAPQLVLRTGDAPTSKPLRAWLAGAPQVVIDPHAAWHEPTRNAELILAAAPGPACDALAAALEMRSFEPDPAWLAGWLAADAVVPEELARSEDPFEPKLLAALEPLLPPDALVWLSSSMPVRDVEACFPQSAKPLRFLSNRGANGIDGVVSSAAGAALASGRPTFLFTGELALLHDVGGLLAAVRAGAKLTIVCINNGGGGIFDFLPVAEHAEREAYERHIATPAGLDLERLAALAGIPYTLDDAERGLAQPGLLELRSGRERNVALHRELSERVSVSLSRKPGTRGLTS